MNITINRAVVEQALEQLKINRVNFKKGPSKSICKMLAGGNDEAILALEAALAELKREEAEAEVYAARRAAMAAWADAAWAVRRAAKAAKAKENT